MDNVLRSYPVDSGQAAAAEGERVGPETVVDQLGALVRGSIEVIKTENLYTFDGERGFALGQGQ